MTYFTQVRNSIQVKFIQTHSGRKVTARVNEKQTITSNRDETKHNVSDYTLEALL